MFVITADQIGSRNAPDIVGSTIDELTAAYGPTLELSPDRTAGDELQILTRDPRTTLALVLHLTRTAKWNVGVGIGSVRRPLPTVTREATGDAFYAAREAVTRAKRSTTRFAMGAMPSGERRPEPDATDAEALVSLLISLRDRRTDAGWALFDLLADGMTQGEAAERLGITPGAASLRARTAGIRTEHAASDALVRLLSVVDAATEGEER